MKLAIRTTVLAGLAVLLAQPLRADDAAKAQKLIDRAIKAICGDQSINKTKYVIIEDKGTYHGMGGGLPYTGRYVSQQTYPGRYRMEVLGQFVNVIDGDKAWMSFGGNIMDVDGEALEVAKMGTLVNHTVSLIPLQKPNKKYKLSLAKPEKVEGADCEGVKIDREGMPTVTMLFDKKTGLIKKTSFVNKSQELGFQEVKEHTIFHEYKKFDGIMSPTKMTIYRDGEKYVESNPQKITYPKSLKDSEFKKPQ